MEKPGQLITSFLGSLALLVVFGLLIRGYSLNEMPWHIYAPGAALMSLFEVYGRPWLKKRRENKGDS